MKTDREEVVSNTARMFAENHGIENNLTLEQSIDYAIGLLENKEAWILAPNKTSSHTFWVIGKTHLDKGKTDFVIEEDGKLEFGILVNKTGPNAKEIMDTLFEIKRGEKLDNLERALFSGGLKLTVE